MSDQAPRRSLRNRVASPATPTRVTPTRTPTSKRAKLDKTPAKKLILPKKNRSTLSRPKLDIAEADSDENRISEEENTENEPKLNTCPLPCRETQFGDITAFLESNLRLKNSGCMYVSGVPGTGKTAIVNAVLQNFEAHYTTGKTKEEAFNVMYINGLTLSAPNRIWRRFYNELNQQKKAKLSPDAACQKLNLYFEKQHRPIILVIDELDQILDKQQAILYRFLDWTAHPSNLFSLICIFNTMHLPESILTMRNASRMGMIRCSFPPYTHEELATIVRREFGNEKSARLNEALTLLSRKVAAISGDARRALEIARRTYEIMKMNDEGGTSASAVVAVGEAFKELFSSPKTEAVRHCSELEKIVLRSIIADLQSNGTEETKVITVMNNTIAMGHGEGIVITADQVHHLLKSLFGSKLILMEHETTSLYNRVSLNVSVPDVHYGLGAHKRS